MKICHHKSVFLDGSGFIGALGVYEESSKILGCLDGRWHEEEDIIRVPREMKGRKRDGDCWAMVVWPRSPMPPLAQLVFIFGQLSFAIPLSNKYSITCE